MAFILDGLESESYDRNYTDGQLVRRIVRYFKPHTKAMALVALVLSLASLADSIAPIVISRAIDAASTRDSFAFILIVSGVVMSVGLIAWLLNYLRQRVTARVVGDVVLTVRHDVFERVVDLDMSFFDETPVGRVVSRVTTDTQDFSNSVTLVLDFLSQIIVVLALTVYLLTVNAWLTVLLLLMAPLAAWLALSFRKLARRVTLDAKRATSTINAHMQESIGGIAVAKGFRQERRLYNDFERNNRLAYRVGLRRGMVLNLIFPVVGIAAGVGTGLIAYLGGMGTVTAPVPEATWLANALAGVQRMTPGEWFLFLQAVGFFWWPMLGIASFFSQFQDGLSAAERVFALIDAEPTVRRPPTTDGAHPSGGTRLSGRIVFDHVGFSYSDKEVVLPDFSLDIAAGETIALVGHTGAGKSSIARLVARFYEFQEGTITIDGRDIRSIDLAELRHQIGIVPQAPFLFTGTVADNIRYGLRDASEDQVRWAASHVGSGDWLDDMPNGLETDVGERGASISLGQRQLVALARVLLKDPAIFILDEATASVDPFTEAQIQEGLDAVLSGRTAIVIAHRLSTIKTADRIIVLDRGRIIEDGTHTGLLEAGGHYAELYNTYFRHQSLEYIERGVSP
ncbi:MAG: ABC transporter ATP-binding protein [Spirochaetota bacterium]